MSQYTLTYFNMTAIAEPIRWIFKYSHVPFEDERIPFDEWQTQKHRAPLGQLPILQEDDKILTQSAAIARYLGKKFDLTTGDDFLDYQVDQVTEILNDARLQWRLFLLENNKEKKDEHKQNFMSQGLPKILKQLNKIVRSNHGPFIAGKKLTYGDFYLANWLPIWEKSIGMDFLHEYPILSRQIEAVMAIPEIKEWIHSRPKSNV